MNIKELAKGIQEAKTIELPDVKFSLVGFGKDSNGNTVVKLKNGLGKGFSIQTNGNLPKTHDMRGTKAKSLSKSDLETLAKEVKSYIDAHGTKSMKD